MVQVNNTPIVLRVKFFKVGSLQYISHLDLVRTMHKIIIRADLPLWYTEGFNPKPKMVFAAPLSIGAESMCEFMDLRLTERMPVEDAINALNKNLTDEMQVTSAYYPETKLTDLKWLSYDIKIKTNGASADLAKQCMEFLNGDKIEVEKKTKKGDAVVDIRPLIKSAFAEYVDGYINISTVLSADQSAFLNPEYLIGALKSSIGILCDPCIVNEHYTIMRKEAFCDDMTSFA
jgi:radical SAM-linked protein